MNINVAAFTVSQKSSNMYEIPDQTTPSRVVQFRITPFGLNNIYSGKVHVIHKYNVKIIGSDSKPVAYLDHLLDML